MSESSITELLVFLLGYVTKIAAVLVDCLKNVIMSKPSLNTENTSDALCRSYPATALIDLLLKVLR